MSGRKVEFEEIKVFTMLVNSDMTRFFVVCDLFFKEDKLTQALGGEEHIYLKENGKASVKVNMEVFKAQLKSSKLLLLI